MTELVLPPFEVSRAAIDQIEAVGGAVRLTLEVGGCCGLTFSFLDAKPGCRAKTPMPWDRPVEGSDGTA
jgi:hypothetical protein